MSGVAPVGALLPLLRRLWTHLQPRRRRQALLVLGLTGLSALAEMISLGAVVPFLGILAAPELVLRHDAMRAAAGWFEWHQPTQLVLPLTLLFIAAMLVAAVLRILLLWTNTRLGFAAGADLSYEVYRRTLYQPYQVHVSRNSSEVISGVVNKVGIVVYGVLLTLLSLGSSVALIVAVMGALLLADAKIALAAAAVFGLLYGTVAVLARRRLEAAGRAQSQHQTGVVRALQEGLGGIRDVLLDGTQPVYLDTYRQADAPMRRAQARISFLGQSPRFLVEAVAVVLVALLAYALSQQRGGIGSAIPLLGALALGAQRLLPALQQLYHSWTSLIGSRPALEDLLDLLEQPLPGEAEQPPAAPAPLEREIELRDVGFRYGAQGPWVLRNLSLSIRKGQRVGFVGSTGSGKSTVMDLLMGLLAPTRGELLVDGEALAGPRVRGWQRAIAHVPQSIYLADASIAENVALGTPANQIDAARVMEVLRQARLAEFVQSQPEGLALKVGERGVRLSGGQRQRIGIARALYKEADVLVFDEATSALDTATEHAIMATIEELSRELTIVIVAHRLGTVRRCDRIFELQDGELVAAGTYEELLASSDSFRRMALAA